MSTHVLDSTTIDWTDGPRHGERFASRTKRLGGLAGGKNLGCSLWEVPPGRTAFPRHAHLGTEEALYVLSGEGTLRIGEDEVVMRAGSYAAFPADATLAHQLLNTGTEPLVYLCMSAASDLDVCLYPDTGKTLVSRAPAPHGFRKLMRDGDTVGYFDDEPTGPV